MKVNGDQSCSQSLLLYGKEKPAHSDNQKLTQFSFLGELSLSQKRGVIFQICLGINKKCVCVCVFFYANVLLWLAAK